MPNVCTIISKNSPVARVSMVVCNKPEAGVWHEHRLRLPLVMISRRSFYESDSLLYTLRQEGIDFIALAGFLWLIPDYLIEAYGNHMVNLHPALLPAYGGKGCMAARYTKPFWPLAQRNGHHHPCREWRLRRRTDLAQFKFEIAANETVESLESRIHALEHQRTKW